MAKELEGDEGQLQSWIERLEDLKLQKLALSVRMAVRKRFPTANELAYDYKSFVVISYSPTVKGIDGIVALAARPTGVFLYFSQAPRLPDPTHVLQGSGKQMRFVQLASVKDLKRPDIEALITATVEQARLPLPAEGQGQLILMPRTKRK